MRPISLHIEEDAYAEFKALAKQKGQSVAALIREAMAGFLAREGQKTSLLDIPDYDCGEMLEPWTRSELFEEMTHDVGP